MEDQTNMSAQTSTTRQAPLANAERLLRDDSYYLNMARHILEYGTRNTRLNTEFVNDILDRGAPLTEKQKEALDNIYTKWHIDSWVKRKTREFALAASS